MSGAFLACLVGSIAVATQVGTTAAQIFQQSISDHLTVQRLGVWEVQPTAHQNSIVVGTAVTMDCCSLHAEAGLELMRGYKMFVDWVNAIRGGIFIQGVRHRLEMLLIDDRSNASNVQTITQYLYGVEGVRFFLGPSGSKLSSAAVATLSSVQDDIVAVLPAAASAHVVEQNSNVFSIQPRLDYALTAAFAELASRGATTVAFLLEALPESTEACSSVETLAAAHGMTSLGSVVLDNTTATEEDVEGQARHLFNASVLVVCFFERLCDGTVQRAIVTLAEPLALVTTQCSSRKSVASQVGNLSAFLTAVVPWVPTAVAEVGVLGVSAAEFAEDFRYIYEEAPSHQSAAAWTALQVLVHTMETAGSLEPAVIAERLQRVDAETVFGHLQFDANGQNTVNMSTVQYLGQSRDHVVAPPAVADSVFEYPMLQWSARSCINPRIGEPQGLQREPEEGNVLSCQGCASGRMAVWSNQAVDNRSAWVCKDSSVCMSGCATGLQCRHGYVEDITLGSCVACPAGRYASLTSNRFCTQCEPGRFAATAGASACEFCPVGHDTGSLSGSIACLPCQAGTFASRPGTASCSLCEAGTVAPNTTATNCSDCAPGYFSDWLGLECDICPTGKYSPRPAMASCTECPNGASCDAPGVAIPGNKKGWWRYPRNSTDDAQWWPCAGSDACLENAMCPTGHTGLLCRVCLPGYTTRPNWPHQCVKCSGTYGDYAAFLATILFYSSFIYLLTGMSIGAVGSVRSITSVLVKVVINYSATVGTAGWVFSRVLRKRYDERAHATGELPDQWLFLSADVLRVSAASGPGWLAPVCWLQPPLTDADRSLIDVLSGPWDSPQVSNVDYETAEALLEDFHWNYQMNCIWFWVYATLVLLVALIFVGLLPLAFHIFCRYSRYKQSLELLEGPDGVTDSKLLRSGSKGKGEGEREEGDTSFHLGSFKQLDKHMTVWHMNARDYKFLGIWEVLPLVAIMRSPKHRVRGVVRKLWKDAKPLLVVALFMVYTDLLLMLWQALDCVEPLEGEVGLRMASSPDVPCLKTSGAHRNVFWFSLLLGLGYAVLAPTYVFFSIHSAPFRYFRKYRFQRAWGFLTTGYQFEYGSWESLVFVRKGIAAAVAVIYFLTGLRVMLLLMVAASFSLLHVKYQPFDNNFNELLDTYEARHLMVWTALCLGILFVQLAEEDLLGVTAWFVTISMLLMHAAFLAAAIRHVLIQWRYSYVSRAVQQALHKQQLVGAYDSIAAAIHKTEEKVSDLAHEAVGGILHAANAAENAFIAFKRNSIPACVADRMSILDQESGMLAFFARVLHDKDDKRGYLHVIPEKMWLVLYSRPKLDSAKAAARDLHDNRMSSAARTLSADDKPSEGLRRYLVKILKEAVEYIVVTQGMSTLSGSLLEFIICAGFAFDSTGMLSKTHNDDSGEGGVTAVDYAASIDGASQALTTKDIIAHMLDPNIFKQELSLMDFHLNLTRLTTRSDSELRTWLDDFEIAWARRRSLRLCGGGEDDDSDSHSRASNTEEIGIQTLLCEVANRTGISPELAHWSRVVSLQLEKARTEFELKPMTQAIRRDRVRREAKREEMRKLRAQDEARRRGGTPRAPQ